MATFHTGSVEADIRQSRLVECDFGELVLEKTAHGGIRLEPDRAPVGFRGLIRATGVRKQRCARRPVRLVFRETRITLQRIQCRQTFGGAASPGERDGAVDGDDDRVGGLTSKLTGGQHAQRAERPLQRVVGRLTRQHCWLSDAPNAIQHTPALVYQCRAFSFEALPP